MEEMNCKERLFATFEQKPVDRVPCPGILQHGTVDLMDACGAYWPEAHLEPEKMAKLAWAGYEIAGLEGVRIPFAAMTESMVLGAKMTKWVKDTHPMIEKYPFSSVEEVEKMEVPDPQKAELMSAILKAMEILAKKCDAAKIPLTGHVGAAFITAILGVFDPMKGMIAFAKNPEKFKIAWEKAKELAITWSEAMIEAGADVIFYNCAPLGNFRPTQYEKWGIPIDTACVRKIKEMGAYVVVHVCSDVRPVLHLMPKLGGDALSIAEMVPMAEAREKVGDKVTLMGNVNQLYTLIKKKPDDVMEESKKCIADGTDILAGGCGFAPTTPLANMKAMVEAAKKYGAQCRLAK
jgi:[methyl-Co(III) methanol-specific corrinoid protein]:coenzyme M methyltransferase